MLGCCTPLLLPGEGPVGRVGDGAELDGWDVAAGVWRVVYARGRVDFVSLCPRQARWQGCPSCSVGREEVAVRAQGGSARGVLCHAGRSWCRCQWSC